MSHIFISYSRKDEAYVEIIVDALKKSRLMPWVDWKNIPKGEELQKEIIDFFENSEKEKKVCGGDFPAFDRAAP